MARSFVQGVGIAVQRVPDEHSEEDLEQVKVRELGAGHYVFGFVLEGAFIPVMTLKAGGIDKKIAAAKAAAAKAAAADADPAAPDG